MIHVNNALYQSYQWYSSMSYLHFLHINARFLGIRYGARYIGR